VGVGIIKNYPSLTGGPGGRPSPPALEDESQGVCDQDSKKLFLLQSTIDPEGPGRTPLCVFDFLRKN
jgi:hypothetical protein